MEINRKPMLEKKPTPTNEDNIEDKFWVKEKWDKNLPQEGFVTDYVLTLRGIETPTKFCAWSALWLVSSVLKRDAFLDFGHINFFANLFLILCAPPRKCGKSTAINMGVDRILETCHLYIKDPILRAKKKVNLLRSKGTAEAVFTFLERSAKTLNIKGEKDAVPQKIKITSNGAIVVSELATFLGRQLYNIGLVEKLTDLYDCKHADDDATRGSGHRKIKDIYVTFFGATTAEGLRDSVPESAFGGGFMSRVIVAFQEDTKRCFPIPKIVEGSKTFEELSRSLAWIAENAQGKFTLSKEANEEYVKWYKKNKEKQRTHERTYSRLDNHLLKVSMLVRAQRYEEGTEISRQDFLDALKLLENTLDTSHKATDDIGASYFQKALRRVRSCIENQGGQLERRLLIRQNSRDYNVYIINQALNQLIQEDALEVYVGKGDNVKVKQTITSNGDEIYKLKKEEKASIINRLKF
jgi:hypothetical protein